MEQTRVEVGGEELGLRKPAPQGLEHQQLVVDVRAHHADRLDVLPATTQSGLEVAELLGDTAHVVVAPRAGGPLQTAAAGPPIEQRAPKPVGQGLAFVTVL